MSVLRPWRPVSEFERAIAFLSFCTAPFLFLLRRKAARMAIAMFVYHWLSLLSVRTPRDRIASLWGAAARPRHRKHWQHLLRVPTTEACTWERTGSRSDSTAAGISVTERMIGIKPR